METVSDHENSSPGKKMKETLFDWVDSALVWSAYNSWVLPFALAYLFPHFLFLPILVITRFFFF